MRKAREFLSWFHIDPQISEPCLHGGTGAATGRMGQVILVWMENRTLAPCSAQVPVGEAQQDFSGFL